LCRSTNRRIIAIPSSLVNEQTLIGVSLAIKIDVTLPTPCQPLGKDNCSGSR